LGSGYAAAADEAVAASGDGGDIAPPVLAVAQRFAQDRDLHAQTLLGDRDGGPDPRDERFPADQPAGLLDQRKEEIAGAAAEPHRRFILEQELSRGEQTKRTEREQARPRRLACHPPSFSRPTRQTLSSTVPSRGWRSRPALGR